MRFPQGLHVLTYDVRGRWEDGTEKMARVTGMVTHTHHLLGALAGRWPRMRVAVTQSGAVGLGRARAVRTPEGVTVDWRGVATGFRSLLVDPATGGKDPVRVARWYDEAVFESANPVWWSLAGQYAHAIAEAGMRDLLVQTVNALVAVCKAVEFGLLDPQGLRIVGVVHDASEDAAGRFRYLADQMDQGRLDLRLIAVSDAVRAALLAHGLPETALRTVVNGLDVHAFEERLRAAVEGDVFAAVAARHQLPAQGRRVLTSARRVPWKGHADLIHAVARLRDAGRFTDTVLLINGAGLVDSRYRDYETDLAALVTDLNLRGSVVLLDPLSTEEVVSCYAAADVAVLASRAPEPFGYANVEAMLAGVPVVATGHGGPLTYLEHDVSGLLVPPSDPPALADALGRLLTDPALRARIGAAGRDSARRLTVEAMLDGYTDVLTADRSALAGAGAR